MHRVGSGWYASCVVIVSASQWKVLGEVELVHARRRTEDSRVRRTRSVRRWSRIQVLTKVKWSGFAPYTEKNGKQKAAHHIGWIGTTDQCEHRRHPTLSTPSWSTWQKTSAAVTLEKWRWRAKNGPPGALLPSRHRRQTIASREVALGALRARWRSIAS